MRLPPVTCQGCGQQSPFHAPSCKQLPPREDLIVFLREENAKLSASLEKMEISVGSIVKRANQITAERDAALLQVRDLQARVESEHGCAEELKEGLKKQYADFAQEMDAKDAELATANRQLSEVWGVLDGAWCDCGRQGPTDKHLGDCTLMRVKVLREKYRKEPVVEKPKCQHRFVNYQCELCGTGQDVV